MELEDDTVPNAQIIEHKTSSAGDTEKVQSKLTNSNMNEKVAENKESIDGDIVIIDNDDSDDDKNVPATQEKTEAAEKKQDDNIVVLDEDEDDTSRSTAVADIIDLVHKGQVVTANTKCINYACNSGKDMLAAPLFCLSYYRVKNTENKRREICKECFDIAMQFYDQLALTATSGGNLFDIPVPLRNDLVEIDDSDSDEDQAKENDEFFSSEAVEYLNDNLNTILEATLNSYNVNKHLEDGVEFLKEKAKRLKSNVGK